MKNRLENKIRNTQRNIEYYMRVYPNKDISDLKEKLRQYKKLLKQYN